MVDEPTDTDDEKKEGDSEESPTKKNALQTLIETKIKPLIKDTRADFKQNFKPGLITSILAFILFCVPFGLGIWQIQRLQWKTDLIAQMEERQKDYTYDFTVINPFQDWEALNYRKAFVSGDFMFLRSIKVKPRTLDGKVGYHLLTPMRLKDGGVVIINRGWVPEGVDVTEEYWNAEGKTITGVLRQSKKPNRFTPDNNPKNGEWYWADLNLIAKQIGVDRVAPILFYQDAQEDIEDEESLYPIGGQISLNLRNTHRMYAVTWFLLAFSLLIVWFFYSWKSPEPAPPASEDGDEEGDEQDEDNVDDNSDDLDDAPEEEPEK